jgi:predicted AAA+ superfamily ATPase
LAQTDCSSHTYFSLDDDIVREGAVVDLMGFVANLPDRVVLDEVLRVPSLFTALNLEVDCDRGPGRFVLTGSTNVLAVPAIQDSRPGGWKRYGCTPSPSASCLPTIRETAVSYLRCLRGNSPLDDKDQVEVDIVLESGRRVAGVEVKAGAIVTASDFRGLRRLQRRRATHSPPGLCCTTARQS